MLKSICVRGYSHLIKPNASIINNQIMRLTIFKSAVSLENIYPHSTLKLTTPEKPANSNAEFSGFIPIDQIDITYSRSTGPGGQNVNTVNTKVDLRFHVQKANWLSDEIKTKLLHQYKTKITKEGYLVFRSELTRSQQLNLADCMEKVRSAIRLATKVKAEASIDTIEKIRRRQERAARERLSVKRQRSQIKTDRADPIL